MDNKTDGGYHAIKGFIYQFDKTLIEILTNPNIEIKFENVQDVNYENYVIQIKNRETQKFSNSKIRAAVIQLLILHTKKSSLKLCLYCHFKDKLPMKWMLNLVELNDILGVQKHEFKEKDKNNFVQNFCIQFSDDYDSQFKELIELIQNNLDADNTDLAVFKHALIQSKLFNLVTLPKEQRKLNKSVLEKYLKDAEQKIFYSSYRNLLSKTKYENLIKKEFFTFNRVNVDNFQRLFAIEYDGSTNISKLSQIINRITTKYFHLNKSPAPFIYFSNIDSKVLIDLKRSLVDSAIIFTDGTTFDGDKYRVKLLYQDASKENKIVVKIVNHLNNISTATSPYFKEIYQFYLSEPLVIKSEYTHKKIQIEENEQILKMI